MRRSTIVDTTARLVVPSALLLSVYLVFAGHNQPGGGFVGALVAGAAIATLYVAGGVGEIRAVVRVRPQVMVGTGLFLAAGTALVPLLFGAAVLNGGLVELTLPVFGSVKVSSTTVFDIGVYGVVVGLVAMVFEAFGEEPLPGGGAP